MQTAHLCHAVLLNWNVAVAQKLVETERHNMIVELNHAVLLVLVQSKAKAEGMKTKRDCVKGWVGLVAQHKELSGVQKLSNAQIAAFIPHLKDVVDMMN